MKYLITGISGFVGGHYLEYIFSGRPDARVIGIDTERPEFDFPGRSPRKRSEFHKGSLMDKARIRNLIRKTRPDFIVHLASHSSVARSWKDPAGCFINNTNIFLNLLEAVRETGIKTRILSAGSSEEYGVVGRKDIPLTEKSPLNPASPYAAARVAEEEISKVYAAGYGIPIIRTRSFNHIGPRQKDIFAVSSFAKQVIEGKLKRRRKIICGNLKAVRDFMDVRDVAGAYDLLLRKGRAGQAYNVCSGRGHKLSEILDMLQKKAGTNLPVEAGAGLMRPIDSPVIIGSPEKLKRDTGFRQKYTLSNSLDDILNYWQGKIGKRRANMKKIFIAALMTAFLAGAVGPLSYAAGKRSSSDILKEGLLGAGAGAAGGLASGGKGGIWKGALVGAGVTIVGGALIDAMSGEKVDDVQNVQSMDPQNAFSSGYKEGFNKGYKQGYTQGYKEGMREGMQTQ